jgi:hypothetical protein
MGYQEYQQCIEACLKCAAISYHCASSCLQEDDVQSMNKCIQLDMECAAICKATADLMLGGQFSEQLVQLCIDICNKCADECEKFSYLDYCQECAEECRHCAEVCQQMAHA